MYGCGVLLHSLLSCPHRCIFIPMRRDISVASPTRPSWQRGLGTSPLAHAAFARVQARVRTPLLLLLLLLLANVLPLLLLWVEGVCSVCCVVVGSGCHEGRVPPSPWWQRGHRTGCCLAGLPVVVSACVRGMGEDGKGNAGVGGPAYRRADVVRVSTHATQTYDVRQIDRLRQSSPGKETGHILLALYTSLV